MSDAQWVALGDRMSASGMVTLSEAARRSGLSTTQIRRWIQAGKLPSAKRQLDGSYRIAVAELVAALPPGAWDKVTATAGLQIATADLSQALQPIRWTTVTPDASQTVTPDASQTVSAEVLQARIEQAEQTIADLRARLEYTEQRRVIEREQAERQTAEMVSKLTEAISALARELPAAPAVEVKRRRWRRARSS